MGDRFYMQQKAYKPKQRLKKEIVEGIQNTTELKIPSLINMTKSDLETLELFIDRIMENE